MRTHVESQPIYLKWITNVLHVAKRKSYSIIWTSIVPVEFVNLYDVRMQHEIFNKTNVCPLRSGWSRRTLLTVLKKAYVNLNNNLYRPLHTFLPPCFEFVFWQKKKISHQNLFSVPTTHNQSNSLNLSITKLCSCNSPPQRAEPQAPERLLLLRWAILSEQAVRGFWWWVKTPEEKYRCWGWERVREKRENRAQPPHIKALPSSSVLWYLFIEMILPETQWPSRAPPFFDM